MKPSGSAACPPEVLEWIAWYPDQGLTERQRNAVESHAAACASCRDEIALVLGDAEPPEDVPDARAVLARVLARIEASEPADAGVAPAGPSPRSAEPARAAGAAGRPALAAAAAVVLALAAGVAAGILLADARAPVLETAGGAAVAVAPGAPELDVVFRAEASVEAVNEALRAVDGHIASGPSVLGRYRVVLPAGSDVDAAARRLHSGDAAVAVFAEPVAR